MTSDRSMPVGLLPALLIATGCLVLLVGARWQRPVVLDAAGVPIAPAKTPTPLSIDLNTAGVPELASLPGIGPGLADRIVADRSHRGPFATLADLDRVPGIGPVTIERIGPWVACDGKIALPSP